MQKLFVRLKQGQISMLQNHIVAQTRIWCNSGKKVNAGPSLLKMTVA